MLLLWEIPKHDSLLFFFKKIQISVRDMGTHAEPLSVLRRFSVSPTRIRSLAKQGHNDGLKQKWRAACAGTGHGTAAREWWRDEGGRMWIPAGKGWKWGHPSERGRGGRLLTAAESMNKEEDSLQAARASQKLNKATWLPVLDSCCMQKTHRFPAIRIQVIPWKLQSRIQQCASCGVNCNHIKAEKSKWRHPIQPAVCPVKALSPLKRSRIDSCPLLKRRAIIQVV